MPAPKITHVLFDLDGLLLDTERIHSLATQAVVGRYGKTFTPELKSLTMGTRPETSARIVVDALNLPVTVEQYHSAVLEQLRIMLPSVELMPGAARLVKHLRDNRIPMAIASSSRGEPYHVKAAKHAGTFALFDAIVNGDHPEVKHGKPAPDTFLVAASKIGVADSRSCLVFEDSIVGVRAAIAANMPAVWVRDTAVLPAEVPADHGAAAVLASLEEFRPEQYGLPPYADEQ